MGQRRVGKVIAGAIVAALRPMCQCTMAAVKQGRWVGGRRVCGAGGSRTCAVDVDSDDDNLHLLALLSTSVCMQQVLFHF